MVYALLATHFVGDFLLQSDWMALNKSKRWDALLLHCAVYAACFVWGGLAFVAITFCLHVITDAITSRLTSRLWFVRGVRFEHHALSGREGEAVVDYSDTRHWFFVVIGADQLVHMATLVATAEWLL